MRLTIRLIAAVLFAMVVFAAARADADIVETKTFFNVTIDGQPVRLEGLTARPDKVTGRLPIALITHGTSGSPVERLNQHATQLAGQARDLALRGWFAAVVVRRGFGMSDGPFLAGECEAASVQRRLAADADDLQAVLNLLKAQPDVDAGRVIAIGASGGGAAVVALGARNPPGLRGVVSASGGLTTCGKDELLVSAYSQFGAASHVPNLWIYAKNDKLFGPDLVAKLHSGYRQAGGDVKLVMTDPVGNDGHGLFVAAQGRERWLMELDGFLRFLDLPTWALGDARRLTPKLKAKGHDLTTPMEGYLTAPTYKALAESGVRGLLAVSSGYADLATARQRALANCDRGSGHEPCEVIMEDNTWTGQ